MICDIIKKAQPMLKQKTPFIVEIAVVYYDARSASEEASQAVAYSEAQTGCKAPARNKARSASEEASRALPGSRREFEGSALIN